MKLGDLITVLTEAQMRCGCDANVIAQGSFSVNGSGAIEKIESERRIVRTSIQVNEQVETTSVQNESTVTLIVDLWGD